MLHSQGRIVNVPKTLLSDPTRAAPLAGAVLFTVAAVALSSGLGPSSLGVNAFSVVDWGVTLLLVALALRVTDGAQTS